MRVSVLAKDPLYLDAGRVVVTQVRVPGGVLESGPRDHRFHVVDFDLTTGKPPAAPPPPTVDGKPGWEFHDVLARPRGADALVRNRALHGQHVWGVAAATLARWEQALGRRVPWHFPCAQLFLVPHAFPEANAYYDRSSRAVFFGFVPRADGLDVYSCLSRDVVAHEVTHAILDGLRERFLESVLPDGLAFHEALADVVALFELFSSPEIVEAELKVQLRESGQRARSAMVEDELRRSALFGLAAELGRALGRSGGLRRSIDLEPDSKYLSRPEFQEPHRRGEVLVAAVMRTLLGIWTLRICELDPQGSTYLDRAAEEGATAAQQLLNMLLRAIDYLPPVDLEFADLLDAVLLADEVIVPTQRLDYRSQLATWFTSYGLTARTGGPSRPVDLRSRSLDYRQISATSLQSDPAEVYRFLWQNAEEVGFARRYYTDVETISPVVRVGPDGLVHHETIATYSQRVEGRAAALRRHANDALKIPPGFDTEGNAEVVLFGGGVVVFDEFGHARLHARKPVDDWVRQGSVLRRLARVGMPVSADRAIAELHLDQPDDW
jgi:hypothetical protein